MDIFHVFLNFTNGAQSRKASHILECTYPVILRISWRWVHAFFWEWQPKILLEVKISDIKILKQTQSSATEVIHKVLIVLLHISGKWVYVFHWK